MAEHDELIASIHQEAEQRRADLAARFGRPQTQDDRCSGQHHLWRRSLACGVEHMRCRCGAVHPDDIDAFDAAAGRSQKETP